MQLKLNNLATKNDGKNRISCNIFQHTLYRLYIIFLLCLLSFGPWTIDNKSNTISIKTIWFPQKVGGNAKTIQFLQSTWNFSKSKQIMKETYYPIE